MNEANPSRTIAAVYPDADTAGSAAVGLRTARLDATDVVQLAPCANDIGQVVEPYTKVEVASLVGKTARGGSIGSAAGAATIGDAALMTPTLFVSAPVVGPLMILGYGALIGGQAGAIRGLELPDRVLSDLVEDALQGGFHVLIVHTANDYAQVLAHTIINDSMAEQASYS